MRHCLSFITIMLGLVLGLTSASDEPVTPHGIFFADDVACFIVTLNDTFTWPYGLSVIGNSVASALKRFHEEGQAFLIMPEYDRVKEALDPGSVSALYAWAYRMRPMTPEQRDRLGEDLFGLLGADVVEYSPGMYLRDNRYPNISTELTLCVRESDHSVVDDPSQGYEEPVPVAAPEPADGVPMSGSPLAVDRWVITAGDPERNGGVRFQTTLGSSGFDTRADSGYTFALVPVAITNRTMRTESLGPARWVLLDDVGYEYTPHSRAEWHLGDLRLNVVDIPPGATRSGFLVFQVRTGVRWLTLRLGSGEPGLAWRFLIDH